MTVEDFLAFAETRPDEEKWELVAGAPVLNASPSYGHQRIVRNLVYLLGRLESGASWQVLPGLGVRLSKSSVVEPDVLVRPCGVLSGNLCDDVIVAFEVLSPSTADRDLRWKRRAYAELPSLAQYVVLAQDALEVVSFDRAQAWREHRVEGIQATLKLSALSTSLPLSELYAGTGLDHERQNPATHPKA